MKYREVYCIRCHGRIFPAHPCPWCTGKDEEEVQKIIMRRESAAMNKWVRKFMDR
jgi:uncharacterized Fe-S cluster protein YjdI